jgi:hypothetical protein
LLLKEYSLTIAMTKYLFLTIIASAILNINYQEAAIAQITPSIGVIDGGNDKDTDGGVTPPNNDNNNNTKVVYPITPSVSNVSENAYPVEKKYIVTPEQAISESTEESMVERIFSRVNEDLRASGITGFYP